MKRNFLYITNIPSPYRIYEFGRLDSYMSARGIDFRALFMAYTEKGRYWGFDKNALTFEFKLLRGLSARFGKDVQLYLNPGVIIEQIKHPPDWLVLGGGWYNPTAMLSLMLAKIFYRKKTTVLLWVENASGYLLQKGILVKLKKTIFSLFDGYVIPGERAKDYINTFTFSKKEAEKIIILRHFVDESIYRDRAGKGAKEEDRLCAKWDVNSVDVKILLPARLSEVKGIIPFLREIQGLLPKNYVVLIAGEGPQRDDIIKFIEHNNIEGVRLLGNQDIDALMELYALADVLALPSIFDPHPFVTIEGLWASLPLLLSKNVGSIPEVLIQGENGWAFDPEEPGDAKAKLEEVLGTDKDTIRRMGKRSLEIAKERFSTEGCVAQFVRDLLKAFPKD